VEIRRPCRFADVERDVVAAPIRVLAEGSLLVGRAVLEQLDAGAVARADHPDLVDDRPRVDVDELVHEIAGRIGEWPECERIRAAEHVAEPRAAAISGTIRRGRADAGRLSRGVVHSQAARQRRSSAPGDRPARITDQLDVGAERGFEVDRLPGGGTVGRVT
jgi:hypothetical protein